MEIKKLQINGFGNVENKTIDLEDGINLLYGKNEAGKSTITGFIKSIFYGVNKNKSGNEFSELEKYKPWKDIDFSGKMEYAIDDKTYTVFRDFNRNNSKVYDENGNDITNVFNKDKSRGSEIGIVHLGIDEETFINTLFVMQDGVGVEIQSQKNIIQKLSNMLQSGQESISFEKIKSKLQKKVLDEIGSERTRNKPINLINKEISEKEQTRLKLLNNRERKTELEDNSKEIEEQIKKVDDDIAQINKVMEVREKYINLLDEKERTYELTLKIKEKEKEDKIARNTKNLKYATIALYIVTIVVCAILIYFKLYPWCILELIVMILGNVLIEKTNNLNFEEDTIVSDFATVKEELNKKEIKELDKLFQRGIKQTFTERRMPDLKALLSGCEKKKNDLVLEEHKIKLEEDILKENIEKLCDLEEQLAVLKEKKNELLTKAKVINIAIEKLEESYDELKSEVIPEMERNIKNMIKETTNGKYVDVIYNNEEGILIENSLGELVPVSKLSLGTIDQMYLGFRLGISQKNGNLPIILDESFAYYDDERLKNALKTLYNLKRQVIIMTCSEREKQILNELKIEYNYLEIC